MSTEFRPWLIQRLRKPFKGEAKGALGVLLKDNPFAFGGGLRHGGFNKEAMDLLRPILEFDYMGASEFEWGAVPKAFHGLGEARIQNKLVTGEIKCAGVPVYYIAIEGQTQLVEEFIISTSKSEPRLKEMTGFYQVLACMNNDGKAARGWNPKCVGWICVSEQGVPPPFAWFVDKEMFEGFKQIYKL